MNWEIKNLNIGPYTITKTKKYVPTRTHKDRYDLFNAINNVIEITNKQILDYGCGFGNLLISSKGKINPTQYTGIDVDLKNINLAKKIFSNANWQQKNFYNPMYNPMGQECIIDKNYDIIIAYSVFTHDSYQSLDQFIKKSLEKLNVNGKLLVSLYTQDNKTAIKNIVQKRTQSYGECDSVIVNDSVSYLVNNVAVESVPNFFECDFISTFYNKSFVSQFGKVCEIDQFQDLLIVDKSGKS